MRKILFVVLITIPAFIRAQENVGGFIQGSLSYSQPIGAFASSSFDEDAAGFALGGLGLNFQFGNKVYKQFGLTLRGDVVVNLVNSDGITTGLKAINPDYDWSMDPAFWRTAGLSFGPHYLLNLKRWAFEFRTTLGALNFYSPALSVSGERSSGSGNAQYKVSEKNTNSWSITADATAKYEFKRNWVFYGQCSYFVANPTFRDVKEELFVNGILVNEGTESFRQQFQMLQYSLGVGYVF